jgi:K+-sensing histidine kinase KdpD
MRSHPGPDRQLRDDTTALLAHDLKSPLSAMTMNLEFALAELPHTPPCEPVREALADCRAAGARLLRMIANLLDVARGDDGRLVPQLTEVAVRRAAENAIGVLRQEAEMRGIVVACEAGEQSFELDEEMVHRAMVSVLEAAARVARRGARLVLRAHADARELVMSLDADVPLPCLDASADARLALRFARAVADAHGGHLTVHASRIVLVLARRTA